MLLLNLSEVYYGKNALLVEAEKCLNIIKDKINDNANDELIMGMSEFNRFKEILCEVFGLDDLLLIGSTMYNNMTMTMPLYISPTFNLNPENKKDFHITTNKYGVCFKKESEMTIMINIDFAVLRNDGVNLTGGELLSIVLHEVGHNFFVTNERTSWLAFLNIYRHILATLIQATTNKEFVIYLLQFFLMGQFRNKKVYKADAVRYRNFISKIKDNKLARTLGDLITEAYRVFLDYTSIKVVYKFLITGPMWYLNVMTNYLTVSTINFIVFGWVDTVWIGYDNEKFSDNFATSYGYGTELMSAFTKMTEFNDNYNFSISFKKFIDADKTGLTKFALNLVMTPSYFLTTALLDNHPTVEQRLLNQTKMLREELNKTNLKPATKQKIIEDLKRMDELEKKYFYPSTKGDNPIMKLKKKLRKYSKAYNGDIREIIRGVSKENEFDSWEQLEELEK